MKVHTKIRISPAVDGSAWLPSRHLSLSPEKMQPFLTAVPGGPFMGWAVLKVRGQVSANRLLDTRLMPFPPLLIPS